MAAIILFFMPSPEGFNPFAFQGAALALFCIGLYATGALPEAFTAMTFFALAMLLEIAPANIVFSGFESPAFWLVLGGFVVGIAVNKTGLGVRIADSAISKFGTQYHFLVAGLIITGIALSFVMPSTMGREILLIPIVVLLTERLGYDVGSPEKTGLIMAAAIGTWLPAAAILPANVPNMIITGMAESLYGEVFQYGEYLLLHFPVTGFLRAIIIFGVIIILFPKSRSERVQATNDEKSDQRKDRSGQNLLSVILILTLALWATDFIHHISPAWIALGAAVICLIPALKLVSMKEFSSMNVSMLIYLAAIFSLGPLIDYSGAGQLLGHLVLKVLPLQTGADFNNFLSLVGLGAATGVASTAPGVGAVLGPLSQDLAIASGLPLRTILMSYVVGYSMVLMPYQVPPLIIAMQLGGVSLRDGTKITLTIVAISFVVLMPINYLWWNWLGMFN